MSNEMWYELPHLEITSKFHKETASNLEILK